MFQSAKNVMVKMEKELGKEWERIFVSALVGQAQL